MYAALWRHTPGPWWLKLLGALVLVAALVLVCFRLFFPWVSPKLPFNQVTMDNPDETTSSVPAVIWTSLLNSSSGLLV